MVKKNMSMTISQIKQKLIEHGVPLPPSSSRKDEYERLYVQEVLSNSKGRMVNMNAGEFSSDDEVDMENVNEIVVDSSTINGKQDVNGKDDIEEVAAEIDLEILADISQLCNEEIYNQLIELGQMVGPVVASTRDMYVKKLALIKSKVELGLNEVEAHHNGHHDSAPINGFSSDEDETTTVPPSRTYRSGSRKQTTPPVESTVDDKINKMHKPIDTYSPVGAPAHSLEENDNSTQGKLGQEDVLKPKLRKEGPKTKPTGTGTSTFILWTLFLVMISLLVAYLYINMMDSVSAPEMDEIDQAIDEAIKEVGQKSPGLDEL